MQKLHHSSSDSQLPFFVPRSSTTKSFRFFRFWRSLPRFQRSVFVIFAVLITFGFAYGFGAKLTTEYSSYRSDNGNLEHPNQVAVPPEVQLGDINAQGGNAIADFDQVDDAKQRLVDAEAAQRNGIPAGDAAEPQGGNLAKPNYPKFRGPQNARQRAVVDAFKHAWKGYKKYAWGHDQLKPVSRSFSEWFGVGLTIVDSLDTMIIMGLDDEFEEARAWVAEKLNFERNVFVNLFETTIRVLGGLLSAYHLSGDKIFAERAADLGERLIAGFGTASAVPFSDVNLMSRMARQPPWGGDSSLSEVATIQLEFRDLSRVMNNASYEDISFRTSLHIHEISCERHDGLCEMFINPNTGMFREGSTITLGARADSYYEYLLKQWLQTGKTINWLRDDYNKSVTAMEKHLIKKSEPNKLTFIGELLQGTSYSPKMDHLACFVSGTLALGAMNGLPKAHLELGKELAKGCQRMYQTATGLWPEIVYFNTIPGQGDDINIKELDAHCLLRPEALEGWFYLYRATGDKIYQNWAWKAFEALEKYAKVENGYSSVNNVKRTPVVHRDLMESFFTAETLKYMYLLFADDQSEIPLDKFVFNSEGHPLPIYDH